MDIETIMKLWRECGGQQHGPHVETVTLPLVDLPKFVEKVQRDQEHGCFDDCGADVWQKAEGTYCKGCPVYDPHAVKLPAPAESEIEHLKAENQRLREIIDVWDK